MRSYIHGGTHFLRAASLALVLPAVGLSVALSAPGALAAKPGGPSVPPKDGPASPETPTKDDPVIDASLSLAAPSKFVPGTKQQITLTPKVNAAAPLAVEILVQEVKLDVVSAPGWEAKKLSDTLYIFTVDAEHALAAKSVTLQAEAVDGPARKAVMAAKIELGKGTDADSTNNAVSKDITIEGAGTVSGFVWQDTDRDGMQDGTDTEPGLAKSIVALLEPAAGQMPRIVDTAEIESAGTYAFEHQPLGKYQVIVIAPDRGWTFTAPNVGSDETKDSDVTFAPVKADAAKLRLGARQLRRIAKLDDDEPLPDAALSDVFALDGEAEKVVDAGLVKVLPPSPSPSPTTSVPPLEPTPTPGGGGTLPTTGSSLPAALGTGAVLLIGGAALTVLARRRRRSAA